MTRADVFLYTGILAIVAGVCCFDWRAGLIVGGLLTTIMGAVLAMR
jgi:hypothetical protein